MQEKTIEEKEQQKYENLDRIMKYFIEAINDKEYMDQCLKVTERDKELKECNEQQIKNIVNLLIMREIAYAEGVNNRFSCNLSEMLTDYTKNSLSCLVQDV